MCLGSAPIHEIADGRNKRIRQFYWKLWYGDNEVLPLIDIRDKFMDPEVTIEKLWRRSAQLSGIRVRV